MKGDPIDDRHEQKRPMATTVGALTVAAVVDWEEDVGDVAEVRKGTAYPLDIDRLHQEERYAGPEEDDAGLGIVRQNLTLKPSGTFKSI